MVECSKTLRTKTKKIKADILHSRSSVRRIVDVHIDDAAVTAK